MKDQNGTLIRKNVFLQLDNEFVQCVRTNKYSILIATLEETPRISTLYGCAWEQSLLVRSHRDFSLLPSQYDHTDLELI